MTAISRRALLAGLGGALFGCVRESGEPGVVRFGVQANLTNAPVLAGLASGRIERALGGVRVSRRAFRAGPRVVEALVGGAIDIGVCGPAPIVSTHARHPTMLSILAGVASGGASLVVAKSAGVRVPADLRGRTLATPQLGSSQDVALRKLLRAQGLELRERGGDVRVLALASSDIRAQMMRGQLDGAWLPEPWATRLVGERLAERLVDERSLWPKGMFPTALMVARRSFVEARWADAEAATTAIRAEVERALATPAATEEEAYAEIKRLTSNAGPRPLFHDAWKMVDFTSDPLRAGVDAFAEDAAALGIVPKVACAALFARA